MPASGLRRLSTHFLQSGVADTGRDVHELGHARHGHGILVEEIPDQRSQRARLPGIERRIGAGELGDSVGILGDEARHHAEREGIRAKADRRAIRPRKGKGLRLDVETGVDTAHEVGERNPRGRADPGEGSVDMGGQLHRLAQALDRGQRHPADGSRMAAHHGKSEMRAVGNAPQVDPTDAKGAAQIFEVFGILLGCIAAYRHSGRSPLRNAALECLAIIGRQRRLTEDRRRIEAPTGGAGRDVVGKTDAALVERDHVRDGAQGEEDRLARPARGSDPRATRAAGEIDDRRARIGVGRAKAHEADLDPPRAGIVAVLRNREGTTLGGKLAAVGKPERIGLDPQGRRFRGEDRGGKQQGSRCDGAPDEAEHGGLP
jgi:hypothetical protein